MIAGVVALLASTAACGDSSDESTSGSASGSAASSKVKGSLTVSIPTVGSDLENRIAVAKGFFAEQGVTVKLIENTGANGATLITSGQADLSFFTTTTPVLVAAKGVATSAIYGVTGGGQSGSILVSTTGKVKSVDDLKGMSKCRLGALAAPAGTWGAANFYKQSFPLNCTLVPYSDTASSLGGLSAGNIDALVGNTTNYGSFIGAGKGKLILDTTQEAVRAQYLKGDILEGVMWGKKDTLASKKAAVIAYIKALDEARKFMVASTDAQLVDVLKSQDVFKTLTEPVLEATIAGVRPFMNVGSDEGYVTEDQWTTGLQRAALSQIPGFDPKSAAAQYKSVVDMSYYDAALGKPSSAP